MKGTTTIDAQATLNELTVRHPETLPVLHRHGLDSCCGGALPLEEAARRHRIELEPLLTELRDAVGT